MGSKTAYHTDNNPDDDGSIMYTVYEVDIIRIWHNEYKEQKYQQPDSDLSANKLYNTDVQEHDGENVQYILNENR
jgi:hypothetical protein